MFAFRASLTELSNGPTKLNPESTSELQQTVINDLAFDSYSQVAYVINVKTKPNTIVAVRLDDDQTSEESIEFMAGKDDSLFLSLAADSRRRLMQKLQQKETFFFEFFSNL